MRARRLAVAAALAAPLATLAPAAPAGASDRHDAVKIEFVGDMRIGCLSGCEEAAIQGTATVVGTFGVGSGLFSADAWEGTTPDLCTSFAQAWGTFSVAGISGDIQWFRAHNVLTVTVSNVNGGGLANGTGAGTAVLLADPVSVTLASCGSLDANVFRIAGEILVAD